MSKPATYLRRLRIGKVDLVDKGAAVNARVTLFKRREPVAKDAAPITLEQVLQAMPEDKRKVVESAIAEAARSVQGASETMPMMGEEKPMEPQPKEEPMPAMPEKALPPPFEPKKEPPMPDAQKPGEKPDQMPEEMKKQLAEEIRKQLLEESKADRESLAKKLADAEAQAKTDREAVAKMRDENLERECVAKAAKFPRGAVALGKADLTAIFKSLAKKEPLSDDLASKLEKHFASVEEVLAKSAVFKEIGSGFSGEAGPKEKLDAIAKALREKDGKLTEAQAFAEAAKREPKLYAELAGR